jgi:cellobiose-specific phosphotransferase system component IIC
MHTQSLTNSFNRLTFEQVDGHVHWFWVSVTTTLTSASAINLVDAYRYSNAYGVYQGMSTTSYSIFTLQMFNSESATRFLRPRVLDRFHVITNQVSGENKLRVAGAVLISDQCSWIGSTQLFIVMASGMITGRLFDRGYLYVLMKSNTLRKLLANREMSPRCSYHLTICGSIIFIFGLFMLSLTKPEQYYQVCACR